MTVHFTLTGRYAGQTYCEAARNENDKYIHIQDENTPNMQQLLHSSDSELCPQCKEVYNSAYDDENNV